MKIPLIISLASRVSFTNLQSYLKSGEKFCFFFAYLVNPFRGTGLFLYSLTTWENQRFSNVFRGIEMDQGHAMSLLKSLSEPRKPLQEIWRKS